jgi:hypothetical protein
MKNLIPLLIIPFSAPTPAAATEMMVYLNVNRLCAAIVQIPYASDNFSDQEWDEFQDCLRFVRQFDGVQ